MTDLPVRLVLDASAIVAYAHGSVDLGEVLCQLDEEPGARFAVPEVCLLVAGAAVGPDQWPTVAVLLSHPQCMRVGTPDTWRDVAALARALGDLGRAVALWWADEFDAHVVSREPDGYADDAESVIEI